MPGGNWITDDIKLYHRPESRVWQALLKVRDGKKVRISTGEVEEPNARKWAQRKREEFLIYGGPAKPVKVTDISMGLITEMENEVKLGLIPERRMKDYRRLILRYIIPFFENHEANDITKLTPNVLQEFIEFRIRFWVDGPGAGEEGLTYTRNDRRVTRKHSPRQYKPSDKKLNRERSALTKILRHAVKLGHLNERDVPSFPKKTGRTPKDQVEQLNRRPDFSLDEYKLMVRALRNWVYEAKNKRDRNYRMLLRDAVLFLVNTGIRPGRELFSIRWRDLEMPDIFEGTDRRISVPTATKGEWLAINSKFAQAINRSRTNYSEAANGKLANWKIYIAEGKNRPYTNIAQPAVIHPLRRLLKRRMDYLFERARIEAEERGEKMFRSRSRKDVPVADPSHIPTLDLNEFVFTFPDGTQPASLGSTFERFLKDTGLLTNADGQRLSLFSLRHTAITFRIIYGGLDEFRIADNFGTSPEMVRKYYRHVLVDHFEDELVQVKDLGVAEELAAH